MTLNNKEKWEENNMQYMEYQERVRYPEEYIRERKVKEETKEKSKAKMTKQREIVE